MAESNRGFRAFLFVRQSGGPYRDLINQDRVYGDSLTDPVRSTEK